MIPMAHPHLRCVTDLEAGEHASRFHHFDISATILAPAGTDHTAALQMRNQLHAVADAEHRCHIQQRGVDCRCADIGHGTRTAAQDDAGRVPGSDPLERS